MIFGLMDNLKAGIQRNGQCKRMGNRHSMPEISLCALRFFIFEDYTIQKIKNLHFFAKLFAYMKKL